MKRDDNNPLRLKIVILISGGDHLSLRAISDKNTYHNDLFPLLSEIIMSHVG